MRGLRVLPWKGLLGSGLGCLLAVFLAGSAHATAYTLSGPVDLSVVAGGGSSALQGQILPATSAASAVCLAGTCDLANQDYLLFQLSVTSGAVDSMTTSIIPNSAQGVGHAGSGTETGSLNLGTNPGFSWASALSGSSDVLVVTYQPGAFANSLFGTVNFSVQPHGGVAFSPNSVPFAVVPEPGTAALLLLGAPALAFLRRRRS